VEIMSTCWIQTFTGKKFDLLDPQPEMVCIEDIAHALSLLCRFTGHTRKFYSVAQHSVMVSKIVPPEHMFAGLMHDAAEAYVGDMSSPLKAMLSDYKRIERNLRRVINTKFGLPIIQPECVTDADLCALMSERDDLLGEPPAPWANGLEDVPRYGRTILPMHPRLAEVLFIEEFEKLSKARAAA
jgi:5'-deoxynucleotidase YfbR-like HD superfamily hydrolase